ncbi:hypothetical protein HU200_002675 [Digitaria exilis]|uniref:Uncharacterized protein n=1 Tax=Digitaria exilis TaxID=1010633 RepID=A0A835FV65_9POAL|nr:hypothetical protein HU200_002675 [Digitaria exilis]
MELDVSVLTPTSVHYIYLQQNHSPGLGICAALFLLVAQSTISAVAVVGYCKYGPTLSETKQILVIVCGVVSW